MKNDALKEWNSADTIPIHKKGSKEVFRDQAGSRIEFSTIDDIQTLGEVLSRTKAILGFIDL